MMHDLGVKCINSVSMLVSMMKALEGNVLKHLQILKRTLRRTKEILFKTLSGHLPFFVWHER